MCRALVLVVAGEDRPAANEQLAVVGEAKLHAGQGRADRPEAKSGWAVRRGGGCAFRQSVPLENEDVECVEELRDLARERRAAGDARPEPSSEPRLHLPVDELVGEPVLQREHRRETSLLAA